MSGDHDGPARWRRRCEGAPNGRFAAGVAGMRRRGPRGCRIGVSDTPSARAVPVEEALCLVPLYETRYRGWTVSISTSAGNRSMAGRGPIAGPRRRGRLRGTWLGRPDGGLLAHRRGGRPRGPELADAGPPRVAAVRGDAHSGVFAGGAGPVGARLPHPVQARLPKERALAGITEMAAANRDLTERFLPPYNNRVMVRATDPDPAFIPWLGTHLAEMLCVQEARVVAKDNTVRYQGTSRQIPQDPHRFHDVKVPVRGHEHSDRTVAVCHGPRASVSGAQQARRAAERLERKNRPDHARHTPDK
jgi:hypothetical protein